jgi:hypothetical protein
MRSFLRENKGLIFYSSSMVQKNIDLVLGNILYHWLLFQVFIAQEINKKSDPWGYNNQEYTYPE